MLMCCRGRFKLPGCVGVGRQSNQTPVCFLGRFGLPGYPTLIRAFLVSAKRGVVERDTQLATYKETADKVGISFHPSLGMYYNTLQSLVGYGLPEAKSVDFELIRKFSDSRPKAYPKFAKTAHSDPATSFPVEGAKRGQL